VLTDGWISNEEQNTIVLTVSGTALKFYKPRHIQQLYRLKIIPIDLRNKNVHRHNKLLKLRSILPMKYLSILCFKEMATVDGEADDGDEIGGEEEVFREYPSNSTTQIAVSYMESISNKLYSIYYSSASHHTIHSLLFLDSSLRGLLRFLSLWKHLPPSSPEYPESSPGIVCTAHPTLSLLALFQSLRWPTV